MKKLKLTICVLIILIIIIVILLLFLNRNNESTEIKDLPDDSIPQDTILDVSSNIQKETNDYKFFAVDNFINTFLQHISRNEQTAATRMLDDTFTEEYSTQNLINNVDKFYSQIMYKQENSVMSTYYIYGYLILADSSNEIEDNYFKVYIDNENVSASIVPLTKEQYNEAISNESTTLEQKEILSNEYNNFEEQSLTSWNLSEKYLSDYIMKIKHNIEAAYNALDMEYREKKFSNNINEFENFIQNNMERFENAEVKNCTTDVGEYSIKYTITDMNDNMYIIERKNAMDYTILLDNETL